MFRSMLPLLAFLLSSPAFAQDEEDMLQWGPGRRLVPADLVPQLANGLQDATRGRGVAVRAAPRGDPKLWITADDYPQWAVRAELEGQVMVFLEIGADGRVSSCEVTLTSRSRDLDAYSCQLLTQRARFVAASRRNGKPVPDRRFYSYAWKLPADRLRPPPSGHCDDCGLPWTAGATETLPSRAPEPKLR